MRKELVVAIEAAKAAGELIRKYFNEGADVRFKGQSFDLVTDADLAAEEVIVSAIKKHFPKHAFLGEEAHSDAASSEKLWVIDPIDGTTNFAHGIAHFAVSIAYAENGLVQAGVVYNPINGDLYRAERGAGSFLNDKRLTVSKASELNTALVATGFYYDRGKMSEDTLKAVQEFLMLRVHGIRRIGAASLDLCYIAAGQFDVYFEYKLNPWDFAAGMLVVEEAGGVVSDCFGKELGLVTSGVLASNGLLQETAVRVLGKFL